MRIIFLQNIFLYTFLMCFIYFGVLRKWYELMKQTSCQSMSKSLQIEEQQTAPKPLLLVIGILSKLSAIERRESIRYSWMKICKKNYDKVQCNFFTDSVQNETKENIEKYETEKTSNKDLVFMPYKGGLNFGLRMYWMLKWSLSKYNFTYFLRIDDDYFLCLDRLLKELLQRPKNGLYWGYLHCTKHVVRIDEGWMLLSRDFIKESLDKYNTTLKCHPFGDQTIALWIQESQLNITYFHDNRVVHAATAFQSEKYLSKNICEKFLGLHGSYPTLMLKYWIMLQENNQQDRNHYQFEIPAIKPYRSYCNLSKEFDWRYFWPHVRYEPKLCKSNPSWTTTEQFKGREVIGHEAIY